jgi:hypothetical protein
MAFDILDHRDKRLTTMRRRRGFAVISSDEPRGGDWVLPSLKQ